MSLRAKRSKLSAGKLISACRIPLLDHLNKGYFHMRAIAGPKTKRRLKCFRFLMTFILFLVTVLHSNAWEFTMRGETAIRSRYLSRTGSRDIFGPMDADNVNLGVNHIKNWPTPAPSNRHDETSGVLAGEPGFGSDAALVEFRSTLYPKLKVNKAIAMEGSVNLTSLGIHSGGKTVRRRSHRDVSSQFRGIPEYLVGSDQHPHGRFKSTQHILDSPMVEALR